MNFSDPLKKQKDDYKMVIDKIKSETAVGIDAQFTHAIIIDFLRQITQRLEILEEKIKSFEVK